MIYPVGATDVSIFVSAVQSTTGSKPGEPATGVLYSALTKILWAGDRSDPVSVTPADGVSVDSAHGDGKFYEVDDDTTHVMAGSYRLDLPDAVFASAGRKLIQVVHTANTVIFPPREILVVTLDMYAEAALAAYYASLSIIPVRVNDGSPSATSFIMASDIASYTLSASDDHYNDRPWKVVFSTGALRGQSALITDYVGSTKTVSVAASALSGAPANGDKAFFVSVA